MRFWLHKLNPNNNNDDQEAMVEFLTMFGFISTGFSDFAKHYSTDFIVSLKTSEDIISAMREVYKDWNFNNTSVNNLYFFIKEMKQGDKLLVSLTKSFNNDVYIVELQDDNVINMGESKICKKLWSDIGFSRKVKILKKVEFDLLPQKLQQFINDNKRKNTTIEISDETLIDCINSCL